MIYKLTSVKRVIAKVFTDLDLKEGDHRLADMIEWAGEALEKIGGFPSFINKVTGRDNIPLLELSNYQVKLPCDFHSMIQVGYSNLEDGPFYPMRYATGSFDSGVLNEELSTTTDDPEMPDTELINVVMDLYTLDYEDALAKINSQPNIRTLVSQMLANKTLGNKYAYSNNTFDYTYLIKGGYIKTNVKEGYLMMAYQAVPTDTEGYPLIPDEQSYIEAIYWYINMKLLYPEWRSGRVRDGIYYDAKRSWAHYSKQAYGNAMMPNGTEQMEAIKNTWLRLVPEIHEQDNFFSTLGQAQIIYNHNG